MTVVTNYSDLPPGVKELLLSTPANGAGVAPHGLSLTSAVARGLAVRTASNRHYQLTDRGFAAAEQLRSPAASPAAPEWQPALYDAVRAATPMLTDLARYIAQLRRWATQSAEGEWECGRAFALATVADNLERDFLGDLAALLMPEAVRHDAQDAEAVAALSVDPETITLDAAQQALLVQYAEVDAGRRSVAGADMETGARRQARAALIGQGLIMSAPESHQGNDRWLTDLGRIFAAGLAQVKRVVP